MENRNHIDELIVKSFLNELDQDEHAILAAWLNAGADNRKYYDAMKKTWGLTGVQETVSSIRPDEEWDLFQRSVQEPVVARHAPRYRRIGSLGIAASLLLLIGFGWYRYRVQKPVVHDNKPVIATTTDAPSVITRKKVNTSGALQLYKLPDGTAVWLYDKSELIWQEPFTGNRRDVYMKGTARFQVAKDSARPFTVLGSKLAVTALGTVFSVNDVDSARTIVIRLYEGKVVVQSADTLRRILKKKIYLLPGQELVYDNRLNTAVVKRFTDKGPVTPANGKTVEPVEELPLPYNDRGNWYMFNNQSLARVFDQLKQIYDVEISYNEQDLQKMYFIGRFSKSDSIETILRQIATLNHLTVVKENNEFIISK